jgi:hypothetical protein
VSFYIRESRNKRFSFLRSKSDSFGFQGLDHAGLVCLTRPWLWYPLY